MLEYIKLVPGWRWTFIPDGSGSIYLFCPEHAQELQGQFKITHDNISRYVFDSILEWRCSFCEREMPYEEALKRHEGQHHGGD